LIVVSLPTSYAQTVWTGPSTNYVHSTADAAVPLAPASADQLTPNVWITRAALLGIFNSVTQTNYGSAGSAGSGTPKGSPSDTEWAIGSIDNYASLTYDSWFAVLPGARGTNKPAVLHLISENIYLAIEFTSFNPDGSFAYTRSTPDVVTQVAISALAISNGQFSFNYTANAGLTYIVESSSDLLTWLPVSTNIATNNPVIFTDTSGLSAHRFYQVIRQPSP
jgi:hypothetical protein